MFTRAFGAFSQVAAALEGASDVDELLHVVARQVSDLVGVERCSIAMRDERAGLFRGRVGHSRDENLDAYVRRAICGMPADGMTLELLRTKQPVIVASAHDDPRIIKSTVRFWRIRSMMAVPMIHEDEVIGVIYLDDGDRAHVFTDGDAEIAAVFGHLAAVAVMQAEQTVELRSRIEAAQRQLKALRRAAAVDERLSDLVLAGRSLPELVETLSEVLGKPCAVYDARDARLAAAAPPGTHDGIVPRLLEPPCLDQPAVREALAEADPTSRAFVVGPLPAAGVLHRYLVAPVLVGGECWGRLVVMEHKSRFSGGDMLTLRRAATLVALQMSTEHKAVEADWNAGSSLAAELLADCCDLEVVQRRAERLGVSLDTPHVVALVAPRLNGARGTADFRAVADAFGIVAPHLRVLATTVDGGVAVLVEAPQGVEDDAFVTSVKRVLARVCDELAPAAELVAGVSTMRSSPAEYAAAHAEARQVVNCVKRFAPVGAPGIFSAADLGAGLVFLATSEPELVRSFAESTFGALVRDASKADLLTTLCSFFESMASIRRCALRLAVHENTIRYRLARVEELTGLAVTHDPDAQLRARLSLLVLMLQGRLPAVRQPRIVTAPPLVHAVS